MICGDTTKRPALDKGDGDEHVSGCDDVVVVPENLQYTIIATRSPENNTNRVMKLSHFVRKPGISFEAKASVIAMTALSIYAMHQMGICHNDQHWDNILVAMTAKRRHYKYTYDNVLYKFNTNARPLLFDWDWAQLCEGGSKNEYLNDFPQIFPADRSRADKTRDIFRFYIELRFMMKHLNKRDMIEKIDRVFLTDVEQVNVVDYIWSPNKPVIIEAIREEIEKFIKFDVGLLLNILECTRGCNYKLKKDRLCLRNAKLPGIHCWQHVSKEQKRNHENKQNR